MNHEKRKSRSLTKTAFFLFIVDLLAVPDFPTGAMENWGLVTFREDRIIFDETVVSRLQKQQLGETIAHEIAHFCASKE